MNKKIVVLQSDSLKTDEIYKLSELGDAAYYPTTSQDEVLTFSKGAQLLLTNKNTIGKKEIDALPDLEYIGEMATGVNNIDVEYATKKGIVVTNVGGYSTDTVAQLTLTMALSLLEHLSLYDTFVKDGSYSKYEGFSNVDYLFNDMSSLTWGIIGLGAIGSRVSELAECFKAHVQYTSLTGRRHETKYDYVDLDTLLATSDIISIHVPLTPQTKYLINEETLKKMKNTAILINVARGPIVDEKALVKAINEGWIGGCGLDVFEEEPLPSTSELYNIKDKHKVILTPHIGWGSIDARNRLAQEIIKNVEAYLSGEERNRVNGH